MKDECYGKFINYKTDKENKERGQTDMIKGVGRLNE
jgi:hypothetical protein